jgi:hypothetical protein
MSNEGYHEPTTEMTFATRDIHRAIVSLMEEDGRRAAAARRGDRTNRQGPSSRSRMRGNGANHPALPVIARVMR